MIGKASRALGLVVVCTVACGDNHAAPIDARPPRAVDAAPAGPNAIVVATGAIGKVSIASLSATPNIGPPATAGADPIVRHLGQRLFIVNRGDGSDVLADDNVLELDEAAMLVNYEWPELGHGPQDVALAGSNIYVPLAGGSGVVVSTFGDVDTRTTIDLSADDPDGQPDCVSAFAVGTDVYVACALLDDTQPSKPPRGNGKIYVIDSTTDTVRTSFDLTTPNPTGLLEDVGDGTLAIATVDPADGTGCIERITTGAAPASAGCIVRNDLIGGHATRLAFQPLDTSVFVWMAVSGMPQPNPQQLMAYDMTLGEMWPPISTPGEQIADVGLCPDGSLVLADVAAGSAGLRVYQLATEVTPAPLSIGAPPTSPHGIVCY